MSTNTLAAKVGVHYTKINKALAFIDSRGGLTKVDPPEPKADLPEQKIMVNYSFKPKGDCLKLIPIGDIHIGAAKGLVDYPSLLGTVKYVLSHDDTKVIFMGDYVDGTIHGLGSPSGHPSPWEASMTPTEQYALFYDKVLHPLAAADKLLGLLPGDHDDWLRKDRGFDADATLLKYLPALKKVPYLRDGFWLTLKVGKQFYTIYGRHGEGGCRTDSGRRAVVQRQFERIDADVKLTGHHHMLDTWRTPSMSAGQIRKSYVVMCGTFLRYQGGYAESWGLYPNATGVAKIKFFKNEWDIHISI